MNVLELRNVSKRFGANSVLNDLNLFFPASPTITSRSLTLCSHSAFGILDIFPHKFRYSIGVKKLFMAFLGE